jgi:hypothetical protein
MPSPGSIRTIITKKMQLSSISNRTLASFPPSGVNGNISCSRSWTIPLELGQALKGKVEALAHLFGCYAGDRVLHSGT